METLTWIPHLYPDQKTVILSIPTPAPPGNCLEVF